MRRLAHDQLTFIGGPLHARRLAVTTGSDTFICEVPEPLTPVVAAETGRDWTTRRVTYKRVRVQVGEPAGAAGENGWFFDVLVADACRLTHIGHLAEVLAASFVTLLSGQPCACRWSLLDAIAWTDDAAPRPSSRNDGPLGILPPDTWSSERWADLCWRCDAVRGTTDVGLCDTCLTDLRAEAA